MEYDFDRNIPNQNSFSIKHNPAAYGKPAGVLPFWVADMDFPAPPSVTNALTEFSRHGSFGYSDTDKSYFLALENWFAKRFGWNVEESWLVQTHGVVNAIYTAVRAFTEPGQGVIIQQPVYHPFAAAVLRSGRQLVVNQLVYRNNRYSIDFDDFAEKIKKHQVKLFILCNPHNPVGRVWTKDELVQLNDICLEHGVLVVSDEIHQDFIYPGHEHLVFSQLSPDSANNTVTCTAPSKTFNIAGLQVSNIFIPNPALRRKFSREYGRSGLAHLGVMGIVACRAAYLTGEEWLDSLLIYLKGNITLMEEFIASHLPMIAFPPPEGTYLAWLDFRSLSLSPGELEQLLTYKGGLWLSDGTIFGAGGAGFQRFNFACPRSVLLEGLNRLAKTVV
jgi:cystathionine beta-lyase